LRSFVGIPCVVVCRLSDANVDGDVAMDMSPGCVAADSISIFVHNR